MIKRCSALFLLQVGLSLHLSLPALAQAEPALAPFSVVSAPAENASAQDWAEWLIDSYLWSKDNFELREDPNWLKQSQSWQLHWQSFSETQRQTLTAALDLFRHDYAAVTQSLTRLKATPEWPYPDLLKVMLGEPHPQQTGIWQISPAAAQTLIKRYPELHWGRILLAEALLERQDARQSDPEQIQQAQTALQSLLTASKSNQLPDYLDYQMGQIMYLQGQTSAADVYFKSKISHAIGQEAIGNFYLWMNQVPEALAFYELARQSTPQQRRIYQKMAQIYDRAQPDKTVWLYLQGLQSGNPDFYALLQRHYDQASASQIIKWLPESLSLDSYYGLLVQGDQALREQDARSAQAFYRRALALQPQNSLAYTHLLAQVWASGDTASMDDLLKQAAGQQVNSDEISYWQALLLLKQEQIPQAIDLLKPLAKNNARARYSLALAYRQQKQYTQARQLMESLVQHEPRNLGYLLALGDLHLEQKHWSEAHKIYELANQVEPYDAQVFYSLGNYYSTREQYSQAISILERALLLQPDSIDIRNNLGNAYLRNNQLALAEGMFRSILSQAPETAAAHYNLACVLALRHESQRAFQFLEQAVKLDPSLRAHAQQDQDLVFLQRFPRFKELVAR